MSIAYVIMAHRAPAQLARLVRVLATDRAAFAIHLDRRVGPQIEHDLAAELSDVPRVRFVARSRIRWGHVSLLDAWLRGITDALTLGAEQVMLLSGQDYPIKPVAAIEQRLATTGGMALLDYAPLPYAEWEAERGGRDRLEYPWLFLPGLRPLRLPVRRAIPSGLRPHGGSAVGSLPREHAEYLVRYAHEQRATMRFYRRVLAPEETFMHTVLLSSHLAPRVEHASLHFVRWSRRGNPHPETLGTEDVAELGRCNALFARKFDASVDPDVLDEIDRCLLRR